MWSRFKAGFKQEPAVIAWAVNGGIAAILAFLVHLTPTEIAAITTITTAAAAVVTAAQARPIAVSVITGAVVTIATAVGAFGLNLPTATIGAAVTALSGLLGLLFRQNLTPLVHVTPVAIAPTEYPIGIVNPTEVLK
jgi:hypothetical protein